MNIKVTKEEIAAYQAENPDAREPEAERAIFVMKRARLMVAAPAMLEALEAAVEQLKQAWACIEHIKEHAPSYEKEASIRLLKDINVTGAQCDAAIKKATTWNES